MEFGEFKPVLRSLLLPPGGLLLGMLLGALLRYASAPKLRALGATLALACGLLFWFLSCSGFAVVLARTLLPQVQALSPQQVVQLQGGVPGRGVQGIVVLGGGMDAAPPEYAGQPQPDALSLARLRYGIWLARQTGLPLGFSGGVGWRTEALAPTASASTPSTAVPASEAEAARAAALADYGLSLRWVESQARDTAENARYMQQMLAKDGVTRIALVTHASHMPRAKRLFEKAGFTVTPAPMGFMQAQSSTFMRWLPSIQGLRTSHTVLYEWVASWVY